jgi:hypothetical protein
MPQIADASTMPGISPPGWISRWGRAVSLTAGRIAGRRSDSSTATAARAIAPIHTASNPRCSIAASLMNGPAPRPMYRASEAKLKASPLRSGGERSMFAASAATKKSASPAPVSSRIATSTATDVARK